jgi:tRNA(adenine34) deaminase
VSDAELMGLALEQARCGLEAGAMPIGAVLTRDGEVIAEAHWRGSRAGLLAHPELVVLMQADGSIEWRARREAVLYTTLEPCLLCMGAAMSFFLGRLVYAMAAPADGAAAVPTEWRPRLGHPTGSGSYSLPDVVGGVCETEARALVVGWLETGVTGAEAEFARVTLG